MDETSSEQDKKTDFFCSVIETVANVECHDRRLLPSNQ